MAYYLYDNHYPMTYFANLRKKESSFYQRIWQELSEIKIIDTHEHLQANPRLMREKEIDLNQKIAFRIPQIFETGYIFNLSKGHDFKVWAEELQQYRGTGYLRAWMIAMEDLYGIEGPITSSYLKTMEEKINEAYRNNFENDTYGHMETVLKEEMHVEQVLNHGSPDEHLEMPHPIIQGAVVIDSILGGIKVPSEDHWTKDAFIYHVLGEMGVSYWYAREKMGLTPQDIITFEDYCDITTNYLSYLKQSGNYSCFKLAGAYERTLDFPPQKPKKTTVAELFNKTVLSTKDVLKFGNYMFHFILEWAQDHWNRPFQIHTGLARMINAESDVMKMSSLFSAYPDIHFDLFHGNYPFGKVPGLLHQIPNISADLCWLPVISPTAAQQMLTELFEIGDMIDFLGQSGVPGRYPYHQPAMRTSLFGGDCFIVEGSYGALQIAKDVLIRTLEDLYHRGHIFEKDAIDLAEQVLYRNPKRIFKSST